MNYVDQYQDCAWVSFEELDAFLRRVLQGAGVPPDDAAVVADVLIEADRRGINSHGIGV